MVLTPEKSTQNDGNITILRLSFNCWFVISVLIKSVQKHQTRIGMVGVSLVI